MELNLVSIIIPFYNTNQALFDRCIRSVLNQEYVNIECIVVNDGSEDEYSSYLHEYSSIDKRIKIISKLNGGLGNARNYGVEFASGDYVFFLDSDDYISPYTIKNGIDLACEYGADVVVGGLLHIHCDELCEFHPKEKSILVLTKREDLASLVGHFSGYRQPEFALKNGAVGASACSKLVKRSILDSVRFENDRFWDEDTLWSISLFNVCQRVVIADNIWYCYIINPQSMMRKYVGDRDEEFRYRAKQEYSLVEEKWPDCMQAAYHNVFHGLLAYMRTDVSNRNNPKKKKERYNDFCKTIEFDEFYVSVNNISFDNEYRFLHRIVKKLVIMLLKLKNKRLAFEVLSMCVHRIKF